VKREQVLFLVTLLILALMGWNLFQDSGGGPRVRSRERPLALPALPPLDPVPALALEGAGESRDPFRPPREEEPLPPLVLPLPEAPETLVQLPPPLPDAGPAWWAPGLLADLPPPPGGIEELIQVAAEDVEAPSGEAGEEAFGDEEADYGALYDSVRLNAFTVLYGRILGENRYEQKPGQPLVFQEVNPRTGEDRFAPQTIPGDGYESFAFARTLRNEIELRVRAVGGSAGSIPQRLALIDWLLEVAPREPVAYARAEDLARESVALAPGDLEVWMVLGRVWEATFQLDRAFALYATMSGEPLPAAGGGEVPGLEPAPEPGAFASSAAPRVGMARILRRLGLDREAEVPLLAAVAAGDSDPRAPLELGRLLLDLERPGEADEILERAWSLASRLPRTSPLALETGLVLGEARLRQGRWPEAVAAFEDVLRAATAGGEERDGAVVAARAGLVAARYLQGDFAAAATAATAAVEEAGADRRLLFLRGLSDAATGAPAAEVVRDLQAAAEAAPLDAAPILAAQAYWLWRLGEEERAREALGRALTLDPTLAYGRYLRGCLARRQGDLEGARHDLRAIIQEQPRCAAAMEEFGWLLFQEGRHEAAAIALRRALAALPERPELLLRQGLNLLALGRLEEAREVLGEAVVLAPDLYEARNALAWAAYADGDLPGAVAEFGELLDRLRDQEDHPQRRYAETWQERIQVHARLRRWLDPFAGWRFRPQWDVRSGARLGVEPRVLGGRLVLRGTHSGAGRTRVSRTVTALAFRSFQVTLEVGQEHRGSAGAFLALESARGRRTWALELVRDREGGILWRLEQGSRDASGRAGLRLASDRPFRVGFQLDREQQPPVLTVTVDGTTIYQGPATALRSPTTQLTVGIFAETRNAVAVDVTADDAELVYLKS